MTTNKRDFFAVSSLAVLFGIHAYLSWQRYLPPFFETGREIYVPLQILEGKILYKDIYWFYGPFAPYWTALLYKLFGVHLNTIYFSGMVHASGSLFLFYLIVRQFLSPLNSFTISFSFLILFVIHGRFIVPNNFDGLYGVLFCLAFLFFLIRYYQTDKLRWLVFSGFAAGFCATTKLELAVAPFATILLIGAMKYCFPPRKADCKRQRVGWKSLSFLIPALFVPAIAYGLLIHAGSFSQVIGSVTRAVKLVSHHESFLGKGLIWFNMWTNLLQGSLVVAAMILGLSCYQKFGFKKNWDRFFQSLFLLLILAASAGFCRSRIMDPNKILRDNYHDGWLITTVPLLLMSFFVLIRRFFIYFKKGETPPWEYWATITLVTLGLSMNFRNMGNGLTFNFRFSYAIPLLLWGLVLFRILPEKLSSLKRNVSGPLVKIFTLFFLGYGFYLFALHGYQVRKNLNYKLSYARGDILTDEVSGRLFQSMMHQIASDVKRNENFYTAMVPTGGLIYFLSGRDNVLKYNQVEYLVCSRLLDELTLFESKNIRFILLDHGLNAYTYTSDTAPCQKFITWVQQHYELERTFASFDGDSAHELGWYRRSLERNEEIIK